MDEVYATQESYELRQAIDRWQELSEEGGAPEDIEDAIRDIRDAANTCLGENDG